MTDQAPAMSPALASRQRRRIIDDASQGLGMSRGAHLSIKGGRLRLIDAKGTEVLVPNHFLDVVIMDANDRASRIYYEGEFDPTLTTPPTCFSDNGTGPSTMAMVPQAPTCLVCPQNERGSATTFKGKPTTACSSRKKLAFIVPGDPAVNIYEFQIPPGSLTNLRDYTGWLNKQASGIEGRQLDIADVVTRIEFDPDPNRLFTLVFKATSYADDDYTLKVIDYIDANKLSDAAVGRNDVACEPEQVKAMLAKSFQPQQLSAPVAETREQFGSLPPRQAAQQQIGQQVTNQPGTAQEAPPKQTRSRTKPAAAPVQNGVHASPGASATAPFMSQAAPPSGQTAGVQSHGQQLAGAGQAQMADDGIPSFLRHTADNAPPAATQTPRFGVGQPPTPPPAILDAVNQAMKLPTRRG